MTLLKTCAFRRATTLASANPGANARRGEDDAYLVEHGPFPALPLRESTTSLAKSVRGKPRHACVARRRTKDSPLTLPAIARLRRAAGSPLPQGERGLSYARRNKTMQKGAFMRKIVIHPGDFKLARNCSSCGVCAASRVAGALALSRRREGVLRDLGGVGGRVSSEGQDGELRAGDAAAARAINLICHSRESGNPVTTTLREGKTGRTGLPGPSPAEIRRKLLVMLRPQAGQAGQ